VEDMNNQNTVTFPNLRAEMARFGDINTTLCEILNISETTRQHRFSGKHPFTLPEILILCQRYKKKVEELFM
jgi:hypothetical protein